MLDDLDGLSPLSSHIYIYYMVIVTIMIIIMFRYVFMYVYIVSIGDNSGSSCYSQGHLLPNCNAIGRNSGRLGYR